MAGARIGADAISVIITILLIALGSCNGTYIACSGTNSAGAQSCRSMSEDAVYYSAAGLLTNNVSIPAEVAVPAGNTMVAAFRAVGHQHYTFNGTAWVLSNASAFLYDSAANSTEAAGVTWGQHFFLAEADAIGGQPSWQLISGGGHSRVTAKGVALSTVDADSISWNLLQATSYVQIISDSTTPNEPDVAWVADVSFVQRLDTQRGLPPSDTSAATTSATLGSTYASVYSALYAFHIPMTVVAG